MTESADALEADDWVSPRLAYRRDRIIAKPNFNRWLVPPAALCIHLCIGMAYGFSVFWLPMSHLVPGGDSAACQAKASSTP